MKLSHTLLPVLVETTLALADEGLHVGTAAVDISPDVDSFQLRSGPSKVEIERAMKRMKLSSKERN